MGVKMNEFDEDPEVVAQGLEEEPAAPEEPVVEEEDPVAALNEKLERARKGEEVADEPAPASDEKKELGDMEKLLESLADEDPRLIELTRQVKDIKDRVVAREKAEFDQAVEVEVAAIQRDIDSFVKKYDVSDQDVNSVLAWMKKHPDAAADLGGFEQAGKALLPVLRTRAAEGADPPPAPKGKPPVPAKRTASIVGDAASAASALPQKFAPGPGGNFDDIGDFALHKVFGVRRS